MASQDRPSPPSPTANARRRSSFAGQFVDLFGRPTSTSGPSASSSMSSSAFPGSITEAAAQAQRRRLSLTTIGLSGSPNQSSPFTAGAGRPRTESTSSANSGSVDESPFEDSDGPGSSSLPPTPFGRRLSFGARALRDVRTGSVGGNGNAGAGGGGTGGGGGFDFAENFRSRAERSSISAASSTTAGMPASPVHQRAKSVATEQPIQAMPKQPKVPDAIQERMLRGDFYMD